MTPALVVTEAEVCDPGLSVAPWETLLLPSSCGPKDPRCGPGSQSTCPPVSLLSCLSQGTHHPVRLLSRDRWLL